MPLSTNTTIIDDHSNQTVQQLTPQLVSIFEKVLSPPEEQLEPETRELLQRTVAMLHKAKPDLVSADLLRVAGAQ